MQIVFDIAVTKRNKSKGAVVIACMFSYFL